MRLPSEKRGDGAGDGWYPQNMADLLLITSHSHTLIQVLFRFGKVHFKYEDICWSTFGQKKKSPVCEITANLTTITDLVLLHLNTHKENKMGKGTLDKAMLIFSAH